MSITHRSFRIFQFALCCFLSLPLLVVGQDAGNNGRASGTKPQSAVQQLEVQPLSAIQHERESTKGHDGQLIIDLDEPRSREPKSDLKTRGDDSPVATDDLAFKTLAELDKVRQEIDRLMFLQEQLIAENLRMNRRLSECCDQDASRRERSAVLFQNVPNPGRETVSIRYYLPASTDRPVLRVHTAAGTVVYDTVRLSAGDGAVEMDCRNLESGFYVYSLYAGDDILDSKVMLVQ